MLNEEQINEAIRRKVMQKELWKDIAKDCNTGVDTLRRYVKKYAPEFIMEKPKLTLRKIERIVEDRKKGKFREQITKKYGISDSVFSIAMKRGVKLKYLTEKARKNLAKSFSYLSFERKKEIHGEKKARELCSDAWHKGMGSNHDALINAGKAGGKKTQEDNPHVQKNLVHAKSYGKYPKYKYYGIEFSSKGELWLGLMLRECGYLKRIKQFKNYQVPCGSKNIDFLVDDKAIEYHPKPKGMNHDNYNEEREKDLNNAGFNGKVIVIEKYNDFYKSGLAKSFLEYVKKSQKVNKKIKKIIQLEKELSEVPF